MRQLTIAILACIVVWCSTSSLSGACPRVVLEQGETIGGVVIGEPFVSSFRLGDLGGGQSVMFFSGSIVPPESLFRFTAEQQSGQRLNEERIASRGELFDGYPIRTFETVTINDSGNFIVQAQVEILPGVYFPAILSPNGLIALADREIDGKSVISLDNSEYNDAGEILFLGQFLRPEPTPSGCPNVIDGVFTPTRLLLRQESTLGGRILDRFNSVRMNNVGSIVLNAEWADSLCPDGSDLRDGLFSLTAPLVLEGETVGNSVVGMITGHTLNDRGDIVFHSQERCSIHPCSEAILTLAGALVKTGDTIGGKTITRLGLPTLDKDGGVIFSAKLQDCTDSGCVSSTGILSTSVASQCLDHFDLCGRVVVEVGDPAVSETGDLQKITSIEDFARNGSSMVILADVSDGLQTKRALLLDSLEATGDASCPALELEHREVWANGHEETNLTVGPLKPGTKVRIKIDPENGAIVEPEEVVTDSLGMGVFSAHSAQVGKVSFTAVEADSGAEVGTVTASFVERRVVILVPGINTQLFLGSGPGKFKYLADRFAALGFSRPVRGAPEVGSDCQEIADQLVEGGPDNDGDGAPNDGCPLVFYYSYNGGVITPEGLWESYSYSCEDTSHSISMSVEFLAQLITQFHLSNPNTRFIVIGHSQGGLIALHGVYRAMQLGSARVETLVTLDGALGGIPPLELWIGAFSCWGYPAEANLFHLFWSADDHSQQGTTAIFDRRSGSNEKIAAEVASAGTMVVTLGNREDCLFNPNLCNPPWVRRNVPFFWNNLSSQVVNGSALSGLLDLGGNCGDDWPRCLVLSHTEILLAPEVVDLIAALAGSPTIR